jgi:hypothetical protein
VTSNIASQCCARSKKRKPAAEELRALRQTYGLAQGMGEKLGSGEVLLREV